MSQETLHGQCHCGNLSFQLRCPEPIAELEVRSCDCTFCQGCGARWTSPPGAALELTVREPALESRYTFATRSAVFHVCGRCGGAPVVSCEIDGVLHAVVNFNTLRGPVPTPAAPRPLALGAETLEARLARRKSNWIAQVRIERAGQGQEGD